MHVKSNYTANGFFCQLCFEGGEGWLLRMDRQMALEGLLYRQLLYHLF